MIFPPEEPAVDNTVRVIVQIDLFTRDFYFYRYPQWYCGGRSGGSLHTEVRCLWRYCQCSSKNGSHRRGERTCLN